MQKKVPATKKRRSTIGHIVTFAHVVFVAILFSCLTAAAAPPLSAFMSHLKKARPAAPSQPDIPVSVQRKTMVPHDTEGKASLLSSLLEQDLAARKAKVHHGKTRPLSAAAAASERIRVIIEGEEDGHWLAALRQRPDIEILHERKGGGAAVRMPLDTVDAVAAMPGLRFVRSPARFHAEGVVSEGMQQIGAPAFQQAGFTGTGVKVAVIDLGFKGLTAAQQSGDLPAAVITRDFTGTGLEANYLHGTGVAEIIHDIAPGAELHLLKIEDEIDFLDATQYCHENQINIINISLGSPTAGPGNGTGPADEIMDELRAAGILIVVAAGNFGLYTEEGITVGMHWEGVFTDANSNNIHEFGDATLEEDNWIGAFPATDDDGNPLDDEVTVVLNYDGWPDLAVDYDLYLYNADTGVEVARSITVQNGSQAPQEVIVLDIPNHEEYLHLYKLQVTRKAGSATGRRMDIFLGPGCAFIAPDYYGLPIANVASSIAAPADSQSVFTVGAIDIIRGDYGFMPSSYSSQGPTNPWNGMAARLKPDIAAPTNVLTTTYGAAGFAGTSAAAPHVAGAAALVLSRWPNFSMAELQSLLEKNALPKSDPFLPFDQSPKNNQIGWGKLHLEQFVASAKEVAGTESSRLSFLYRDDRRNLLYLGDPGHRELVVIDAITATVAVRIPMDTDFQDMAISKDNTTLAIAGSALYLVDSATLATKRVDPGFPVTSVAFAANGDLFLLKQTNLSDHVYLFSPAQGRIITSFGGGSDLGVSIWDGLVRTDDEGKTLFVMESWGNRIQAFDISGMNPVFLRAGGSTGDRGKSNFIESEASKKIFVKNVVYQHVIRRSPSLPWPRIFLPAMPPCASMTTRRPRSPSAYLSSSLKGKVILHTREE